MKKTQMISVLLAITLFVIFFGLAASKVHAKAPSSGTIGDNLTWTLENDVTLIISGTGDIPESSASRLAPWYSQQYYIETIIISDGITSIPEEAFQGYENLTKVIMPDTVTSIGESAFANCRKLSDIKLSNNLAAIEKNTFRLCYALTEITIPDGVTTIGSYAFYDCNKLTSITIPSSVTYVERGAFTSCNRLTDVYISDITAWLNIRFDADASPRILDANDYDKTLYLDNQPITSLVIPDGIQEIAPSAFYGCNFTRAVIPSSVTKIHNAAFAHCRSLTSVDIPDQVTLIGASAFLDCEKLNKVDIGKNVSSIGGSAFRECTQLQQITIPDSVTTVGKRAFADCSALASAAIGTRLTQLNEGVFSNCSNLATISIPGNVSTIGEQVFVNCTKLTSATIGNGVTSIGKHAFGECKNLSHITFPDSVTVIGQNAFEGCSALQNLVFGKGLQVIEQSAFERCSNLANVEFPDGLTTIESCAFYLCPEYEVIFLPASIETIGTNAFQAVWHVFFKGTENQWNSLFFDPTDSGALNRERVHFNCTGNELQSQVIAPTCTKYGYTAYTCSRCGDIRHNQRTDAIGHSYGSWYIAKEATFASKGVERRDCKHCGRSETKDIPAKKHTDKNNDSICDDCGSKFCINHTEQLLSGKAATCSQDGLTEGKKCSVCDAIIQAQEVIPASGHNYGEWTTTTEGQEERACVLCGEKEQRTATPTSPASTEEDSTLLTTQPGTNSDVPASSEEGSTQPDTNSNAPALSDEEQNPGKVNSVVIILIVTAVAGVGAGSIVRIKRRGKK